ncbi:haloacid dehalogenase-like hydrolase domain-containing protein 3 [Clavelina lepadiformis]
MMIRLVTFDVTNTLLRPLSSVGEQYAAAIGEFLKVDCDEKNITKSFSDSYKTLGYAHPNFGRNCGISPKQWWASVFLDTLMHAGITSVDAFVSKDKCQKHLQLWKIVEGDSKLQKAFESVYGGFKWSVIDGALPLLRFLKHDCSDVLMGIISNNDDRVEGALNDTGLLKYIDFVITSHNCGFEKPDHRIFVHALKQSRKIAKPRLTSITLPEMLHIGDNFEKDYLGAKNAGCKALLLDTDDFYKQSGKLDPSHCIKNLLAGKDLLKTLVRLRSVAA